MLPGLSPVKIPTEEPKNPTKAIKTNGRPPHAAFAEHLFFADIPLKKKHAPCGGPDPRDHHDEAGERSSTSEKAVKERAAASGAVGGGGETAGGCTGDGAEGGGGLPQLALGEAGDAPSQVLKTAGAWDVLSRAALSATTDLAPHKSTNTVAPRGVC